MAFDRWSDFVTAATDVSINKRQSFLYWHSIYLQAGLCYLSRRQRGTEIETGIRRGRKTANP